VQLAARLSMNHYLRTGECLRAPAVRCGPHVLELCPGGRLIFDVDFPNAFCPACLPRA
jgi:hypothetical protein